MSSSHPHLAPLTKGSRGDDPPPWRVSPLGGNPACRGSGRPPMLAEDRRVRTRDQGLWCSGALVLWCLAGASDGDGKTMSGVPGPQ